MNDRCATNLQVKPWIGINLGSKHVVRSVNIWFTREDPKYCCWRNRRWNIEVRVGNSSTLGENPICKNLTRNPLRGNWRSDCDTPMVGRYITLQVTNPQLTILDVLDIEAIGYKYIDIDMCKNPESFNCIERSRCNRNVPNNAVVYMTGFCPGGCNADRVGKFCEKPFKVDYWLSSYVKSRHQVSVLWHEASITKIPDSGRKRMSVAYVLFYRKLGTVDWITAPSSFRIEGRKILQNITGLETNTGYEVAVKLKKLEANLTSSLLSRISTVYTGCDEPAVGPRISHLIQGVGATSSKMYRLTPYYVGLDKDELNCHNKYMASYSFFYKLADSPDSEWTMFSTSNPPDMEPYTRYRIRMGVKNEGNKRYVFGDSIEVIAGDGVSEISAMNTSSGRVNVTWKIPGPLKHLKFEFHGEYKFRQRIGCPAIHSGKGWQISPFPTNNTDMEFPELSPYSTYDVRILAVQLGEGAIRRQYVTTRITTSQSDPVGSPKPPKVTPNKVPVTFFQKTTSAGVNFYNIPCNNRNGIFSGFHYKLYEKSTGEVVRENITMRTFISLNGLKPYTTYVVSYAWTNEAGKSEQSNNTEFTTDEAARLKIHITLKQVSLKTRSGSHLSVEYHQQEGGGQVLKYAAQCGETTAENVQPLRSSKSSWNIKSSNKDKLIYDLKPSTWYGCQGAAMSKKGWSRPSPYVYVYIY
ncbi:uncharacterized protein LOC141914655 [Tubulanus polymorphus]|uniref:uncharacterized protein LOC141914655 n=1 Tax=Tubulanus polymorphus TaxID=672921 RepID=UPI003DA41661